jgi:hypothetical protein
MTHESSQTVPFFNVLPRMNMMSRVVRVLATRSISIASARVTRVPIIKIETDCGIEIETDCYHKSMGKSPAYWCWSFGERKVEPTSWEPVTPSTVCCRNADKDDGDEAAVAAACSSGFEDT